MLKSNPTQNPQGIQLWSEVCPIHCSTANPVQEIVAETIGVASKGLWIGFNHKEYKVLIRSRHPRIY
ncbi:hypothetical protein BJP34_32525 [Moorena producens PAL-8-15-08-1]|uniref:Uncharacterized protein n=1 Tax=Moorena producens PAL-8-15-08-1 TaxID=1458985 RepID=A0A1D8U0T6_9CYAN|nr:hypothetical protein [Moorena producens]AOX03529.1 hypothetical protein BJP34_32525 [Moorena producens PAL-8-15-08-1]